MMSVQDFDQHSVLVVLVEKKLQILLQDEDFLGGHK